MLRYLSQVDLEVCQWYSESTCCEADEGSEEEPIVVPIHNYTDTTPICEEIIPSKCQEYIDQIECAHCSPDFGSFAITKDYSGITVVTGFRVCEKFANKMYDNCKEATMGDGTGRCVKVEDEWENSADFWQNGPYTGILQKVNSDKECFNGGSMLRPMIFLAVVVMGVVVGLL